MNLKDKIEKPLIALVNLAEQVDVCKGIINGNQRIVDFFRDFYSSPIKTLKAYYRDLTH